MNRMNRLKSALLISAFVVIAILSGAFTVVSHAANAAADSFPAGNPEEVAAVILHTNDVHVGFEDNIGYDGLALYQKELEAVYDHVLLIDAGDAIQGGSIGVISKGAQIVRMMNHLGYDLAVPGNHEFDFGFEALAQCAESLQCGYVCANFCTADGKPVFEPWRILDAGEIRIGLIGAVTPDTFTKTKISEIVDEEGRPVLDFLADHTGERLSEALQKYIDEVRDNGADYVIQVSHLGNNDTITEQFRSEAILEKLTGLDAVIDGHSHEIYNRTAADKEGRQVPFAQAGTKMQAFGQLTIYKDGHMEEKLIDSVPKPEDIPFETVMRKGIERYVDPDMKSFMDDIVASYADVMERRIGDLSYDMIVRDENGYDVSRVAENPLCDLVADAFRAIGGTQVALLNAGSVRNNLEAGTVTYQDVMDVLPYSSDMMTAKVTGQMLLDALEYGVSKLPAVSAVFPQVSGMQFCVNKDIESSVRVDGNNQFVSVDGEYRVSDVKIGGKELDPKAEYTVTGTSYLLNGGDGYSMFKEAVVLSMAAVSDNEVLIQYIEENLGGVIPEDYREPQNRILWKP